MDRVRAALLGDIRLAWRWLAREPGFSAPVLLSFAAGIGVLVAILGLMRVESVRSLRIGSVLAPEQIRDAGWLGGWHGPMWSAGQLQAADFEEMLHVLAAVAGLAFFIACFTVVILVLIRAATRTPELALRVAVGATRRRLIRRLLSEGIALAGLGGALGLVVGGLGASLARHTWPAVLTTSGGGAAVWVVPLAFLAPLASVVPFAVAVAAGVLRRADLSGALVAGADGTAGRGELILQEFLAVVQLAASVSLVIGAGLLLRNTAPDPALTRSPRESGAMLYQIDVSLTGEGNSPSLVRAYGTLLGDVAERVGHASVSLATPGARLNVGSLALVTAQCGRCSIGGIYVPLMPGYVHLHAVSPEFFSNSGVRVLEGREFTPEDRIGSPRVMLVNRSFAESHFEGGRPLGHRVQIGAAEDPWYTVVGIVGELQGRGVGPPARPVPVAYIPVLQEPTLATDLTVAAPLPPESVSDLITNAVSSSGNTASISAVYSLADYLERQAAPVRWLAVVFVAVGGLVLMLGMFGTYTVMRFKIARHRREIGLRRALGASKARIVSRVVLQSIAFAALGGALGAWSGMVLAGWLDTMVPGLEALDLPVYGVAVASLSVAALAGGSLSVRQATAVDPADAIRTE